MEPRVLRIDELEILRFSFSLARRTGLHFLMKYGLKIIPFSG
jgi:hypothetical protein